MMQHKEFTEKPYHPCIHFKEQAITFTMKNVLLSLPTVGKTEKLRILKVNILHTPD